MKSLFEHKNFGFYAVLLFVLLVMAGFGGYALWTGKSLDLVASISGPFSMIAASMVGYMWGSSEGSKKKTELLNKKDNGPVAE
jgi:hypothetical protein